MRKRISVEFDLRQDKSKLVLVPKVKNDVQKDFSETRWAQQIDFLTFSSRDRLQD